MSVILIAYCLLETHFHLFLQTMLANLPEFMHRLHTAYARWYNRKRERTGHLFTSRYKASPVQDDRHALELSRYIHLNPVRAGLVSSPEEWDWSSFRHYAGLEQSSVLSTDLVMHQISPDPKTQFAEYRRFVTDGLENGTAWVEPPLKHGLFLGDDNFIDAITKLDPRADPGILKQLTPPPLGLSMEEILDSVLSESHLKSRTLKGSKRHADTQWRNMFVYLSRKLGRTPVRGLADFLKLSPGEVSRITYRFQEKVGSDESLLQAVERIALALGALEKKENVKM